MPGSAATLAICFMAGRKPPMPAWKSGGKEVWDWVSKGPCGEPELAAVLTLLAGKLFQLLKHEALERRVDIEAAFDLHDG